MVDIVPSKIVHSIRKIQNVVYTPETTSIINQAENKDVIILLGNSRSGKSVAANHLMGTKLVGKKVRGKTFNISKQNASDPGPAIGGDSAPQITLPTVWSSPKFEGLIVDTPGWKENGEEQDVINYFCISEIIWAAKSVKIIFVLDVEDIANNNIEHFAKIINIIHDVSAYHGLFFKGVVYLFTKNRDNLTPTEICVSIKEKVLSELNVKQKHIDILEIFNHNFDKIFTIQMPEKDGAIEEDKVFRNIRDNINSIAPMEPRRDIFSHGMRETTIKFLSEAQKYLTEKEELSDIVDKVYRASFVLAQDYYIDHGKKDLISQKQSSYVTLSKYSKYGKPFEGEDISLLQKLENPKELLDIADYPFLEMKIRFVAFVDRELKSDDHGIKLWHQVIMEVFFKMEKESDRRNQYEKNKKNQNKNQ